VALGVKTLFELLAERNKNEHKKRMLKADISSIFFIEAYFVNSGDLRLKIKIF